MCGRSHNIFRLKMWVGVAIIIIPSKVVCLVFLQANKLVMAYSPHPYTSLSCLPSHICIQHIFCQFLLILSYLSHPRDYLLHSPYPRHTLSRAMLECDSTYILELYMMLQYMSLKCQCIS